MASLARSRPAAFVCRKQDIAVLFYGF